MTIVIGYNIFNMIRYDIRFRLLENKFSELEAMSRELINAKYKQKGVLAMTFYLNKLFLRNILIEFEMILYLFDKQELKDRYGDKYIDEINKSFDYIYSNLKLFVRKDKFTNETPDEYEEILKEIQNRKGLLDFNLNVPKLYKKKLEMILEVFENVVSNLKNEISPPLSREDLKSITS